MNPPAQLGTDLPSVNPLKATSIAPAPEPGSHQAFADLFETAAEPEADALIEISLESAQTITHTPVLPAPSIQHAANPLVPTQANIRDDQPVISDVQPVFLDDKLDIAVDEPVILNGDTVTPSGGPVIPDIELRPTEVPAAATGEHSEPTKTQPVQIASQDLATPSPDEPRPAAPREDIAVAPNESVAKPANASSRESGLRPSQTPQAPSPYAEHTAPPPSDVVAAKEASPTAAIEAVKAASGITSTEPAPQAGKLPQGANMDLSDGGSVERTTNISADKSVRPHDRASMATMQPLLAEGVRIDGLSQTALQISGADTAPSSFSSLAIQSGSGVASAPGIIGPGLTVAAAPQTILAVPAEIPSILVSSLSGAEPGQDSITVQLDPPELGRVSIDFKFEAQGLQTVSVSAETPEAMRRLRLMHSELVQALEQNGLSSDSLNYSQGRQQDARSQQASFATKDYAEPVGDTGRSGHISAKHLRENIAPGAALNIII